MSMYEYKIISPPFTLEFDKMSNEELNEYYSWFMGQIPERIAILTKVVKNTPGFENWEANYSPKSLDDLGEWFAGQVETRPRTTEEKQEIVANSPELMKDIECEDWELTNKTFSLAMDIGMYLSQVFLNKFPNLKWEQKLRGSKRYIDYGQPVLEGFGGDVFNPVHMLVTQAYGLARKTREGDRLRELYDIWIKLI